MQHAACSMQGCHALFQSYLSLFILPCFLFISTYASTVLDTPSTGIMILAPDPENGVDRKLCQFDLWARFSFQFVSLTPLLHLPTDPPHSKTIQMATKAIPLRGIPALVPLMLHQTPRPKRLLIALQPLILSFLLLYLLPTLFLDSTAQAVSEAYHLDTFIASCLDSRESVAAT